MTLHHSPNCFYGSARYHGEPAPSGMLVTALVDYCQFTLPVDPAGKFGLGTAIKLMVGGNGEDIPDQARISFYVSDGSVRDFRTIPEAGHAHFFADEDPHVTAIALCQD